MWYNERIATTEWNYVLPIPVTNHDFGGYATREYPFGLYAVASCLDADCDKAQDWMATQEQIRQWVRESGCFEVSSPANDPEERYTMFHIVSPSLLKERMGIHQQDMYLPIVVK